ncbi:MAG TPA: ABC transporter permease [Gemmatimonadales bacterium]
MPDLIRDLRYAARMLTRTPGLSAIAVLTIALGIGLTTHTFSIVYGSVIRGLPYEGAERLVILTQAKPAEGSTGRSVPIHDYQDWRDQQTVFEGLAALYAGTVNLADDDLRPERVLGAFVTWNALAQAGARPVLGRSFLEGDDLPGAAPTLVLGHDVWQTRYNGDPTIVGRTVRANGRLHTIIGVMPEKFAFPFDSHAWLPLGMDAAALPRGEGFWLNVFGRLKPGVSMEGARGQLAAISSRLAAEYPVTNAGLTSEVKPFTEEYMPPQIIAVLWAMLVAVFGVLLIACANVANLLLARAASRSREVAVRTVLGARRRVVIRQLLAESLVLAVVGGLIGIGLSYLGIAAFNAWIVDIQKPFWIEIALFPPVLVFAIAATLSASILAGLIPALKASGAGAHDILKDATRGSSLRLSRFSTVLVVGEIAVSCGLLIAAGLMVKSIVNVRNQDLGFVPDGIFTARVGLNEVDYGDAASQQRFFEELHSRVAFLPGVQAAALTSNLPMSGAGQSWYGLERQTYATDRDYPWANRSVVTPGFFATFGVRVIEGRDFTPQDRQAAIPVALVNQAFVDRNFPTRAALGERLRLGRSESEQPWLTIVGVVPDLRVGGGVGGIGSDQRLQEHVYVPLEQNLQRFLSMAIRTGGNPQDLAVVVRETVSAIDPNLPIYNVDSMAGVIETNTWAFRVFGSLFAIFGVMALFMAAVGLYGVMAFSVTRRRQEIGIRMAVGANPRNIARLVLGRGAAQIGIGMTAGLALGVGLAGPLRFVLFGVNTTDPSVYATIVFTLAAAGLLACVVPAHRAMRVDLVNALRPE